MIWKVNSFVLFIKHSCIFCCIRATSRADSYLSIVQYGFMLLYNCHSFLTLVQLSPGLVDFEYRLLINCLLIAVERTNEGGTCCKRHDRGIGVAYKKKNTPKLMINSCMKDIIRAGLKGKLTGWTRTRLIGSGGHFDVSLTLHFTCNQGTYWVIVLFSRHSCWISKKRGGIWEPQNNLGWLVWRGNIEWSCFFSRHSC